MNNGLWQAFHVMSIAILDIFIVDAHLYLWQNIKVKLNL